MSYPIIMHNTNIHTNIGVRSLQQILSSASIHEVAQKYNADFHAQKLPSDILLHLLTFGLIRCHDFTQQSLAMVFSSKPFMKFAGLSESTTLNHSAISRRLAAFPVAVPKEIYSRVVEYADTKIKSTGTGLYITDSTWVTDLYKTLDLGIEQGNSAGKSSKAIKYTFTLCPNMITSLASIFTRPIMASENIAMPEHWVETGFNKKDVMVFDEGLSNVYNFNGLRRKKLLFVGRLSQTREALLVDSNPIPDSGLETDRIKVISDDIVRLRVYPNRTRERKRATSAIKDSSYVKIKGSDGKTKKWSKYRFRRICILIKATDNIPEHVISLITDISNYSALDIADIYRKRWNVEVFIKFLKQNFHIAHLISFNPNGIKVVLWMTLVAAIMIRLVMSYNCMGARDVIRLLIDGYIELLKAVAGGRVVDKLKLPWFRKYTIGPPLDLKLPQMLDSDKSNLS